MTALRSVGLGIGAGLLGIIILGFATNVTFDVVFGALNLGNEKDRAIMGMRAAMVAMPGGFFLGLWFGIRKGGHALRGLAIGCLFLAGLSGAGVAAIAVTFGLTNEPQFNHSIANVEVRLPAGVAVPPLGPNGKSYQLDKIGISVLEGNRWRGLEFTHAWRREDGDRTVLMASGWLGKDEKPDAVQLIMPGQPFRQFNLDLAPNPEPTKDYTAWRRVDSLRDRGEPDERAPDASDATEMRVRITRQR
jgi:hypothetical protein